MIISIIDRYLSLDNNIKKQNFQLLGITSLLNACKHEEIDLPKIKDFIYITDNAYKKNEVLKMEEKILKLLNYNLLYPSIIKFYEILSFGFNFNKKQFYMGKYLMENFLIDYKYCKYNYSVIACGCIYIVMKFFKIKNYQESYNNKYFNIDKNNNKKSDHVIKECAKDICNFHDNINKTNFMSTQKKYSREECECIIQMIQGK